MIYLLDTDHVSALQSVGEANRRLVARLRRIAPDDYGTTIITFEEQMRGRLAQVAASQSTASYAALDSTFRFYSRLSVWQYTDKAAQQREVLRQERIRVGSQDLKIAAIALTTQATLLTRNRRDFARVPNLLFEDWTA